MNLEPDLAWTNARYPFFMSLCPGKTKRLGVRKGACLGFRPGL